jgi:hypothetical protein
MSDRPQDSELRARFAAQRRAEADDAPSFAEVVARARAEAARPASAPSARRFQLRRLYYAGGVAAAATIAAVLMLPRGPSNEEIFEQAVRTFQSDPAAGAWRSPTDGLLDVPGLRLMSTVPMVGPRQ